jgi:DNA-binding transcriptional MerR regulator
MEDHSEKLYYSIGEVAKMFDVNTSLIRFWEKEFDIIKPQKNKKGNRMFTKKDVDNFHLIFNLVKEQGYTLQGAKEKLSISGDASEKNLEITKRLKKVRNFLMELRETLN